MNWWKRGCFDSRNREIAFLSISAKPQKSSFMKRIIILTAVLLNFTFAFGDEQAGAPVIFLSLEEAIETAYENNNDIAIEEEQAAVAKAGITKTGSKFLPRILIGAGYTHNDAVLNIPPAMTVGSKKDVRIFTGYYNENQIGISFTETLFNGGANMALFKQARLRYIAAREKLKARKLEAAFDVKRLYNGLLLAYETLRIAEELCDQAESHYLDVEKKYQQGTASWFDVLQSKVQVSKVTPQMVRARNEVDLTAAELKKILGLGLDDNIILEGRLVCRPVVIDEDFFRQQAYFNNPDIILAALGIDISKKSIQAARAGWLPRVEASGAYGYKSNNWGHMFDARHNNWNVGVQASLSIFDGFSTTAKIREAKRRYCVAVLKKSDMYDQVAVAVRRGCLDIKEAGAIIRSQEDNIDEAREALRISVVRYDNGEGTNLDVLDAQVSLSQIETNLSQGIYDYIIAAAYLDMVMGVEETREDSDEEED